MAKLYRLENFENEVIKFEQLNIDLEIFSTTTIKKAKIQETSTFKLMSACNQIVVKIL